MWILANMWGDHIHIKYLPNRSQNDDLSNVLVKSVFQILKFIEYDHKNNIDILCNFVIFNVDLS